MSLDQTAIFFTGSILIMLGFVVITIGIVVINNILHKYWKPIKFAVYDYQTPRFVDEDYNKKDNLS
jgi:hypothetical protein